MMCLNVDVSEMDKVYDELFNKELEKFQIKEFLEK